MSRVSIVGAYNTKFGSFVQKNKETGEVTDVTSIYELLVEAGRAALADAGIPGRDVDGVWVGSCAPGLFANQEHLAAMATEIDPEGLRFKPMTRCEDACASGSVALYNALYAVEAGRARVALVIGVEKMNLLDTKGVTHALATCSYWPEEGGEGAELPVPLRRVREGLRDALRPVGGVTRAHARHRGGPGLPQRPGQPARPLRQGRALRQGSAWSRPRRSSALPAEKNPLIADPLRLHDCSLISDGAAAVVIMRSDDVPRRGRRPWRSPASGT